MGGLLRGLVGILASLSIAACGGGGGGGTTAPDRFPEKGVFTGVLSSFNFDFDTGGAGGGIGEGADGDGGIGAGGALGQFLNALVVVSYLDGTPLGSAPTDAVNGMVTIKPGRDYTGGLIVEIRGQDGAQYFEEGKNTYVPFPAGQVIRTVIPRIDRNIGVTPFTEAAYTLAAGCLVEAVPGVCDAPVAAASTVGGAPLPPADVIAKANSHVTSVLNQQFPSSLHVDDIGRLPYIVGAGTGAGAVPASSPRGRYGLVNVAFSKQAAMYNTADTSPTLLAIRQLSRDLSDGTLDGLQAGAPAADPDKRTYDPHTLTTELGAALAQQTSRYGTSGAVGVLPRLVGYGSARYDSYFFEARLVPDGKTSTVAVATQAAQPTRTPGQSTNYVSGGEQRGFTVFGNLGSGALFIKTDSADSTSRILAVGDNTNGELGSGNREPTSRSNPSYTISLPGVVTHMAGGFGHTLARLSDGAVYAWGDNAYGQLGQGSVGGALPRALVPTRVPLPAGALSVAAGNASSFALLADGRVFSWGSNWGFGTLGNGAKDGTRPTPGAVLAGSGELTGVVQMAVRDNDGIALRRDGTVWTWGSFPAVTDATDFVPVANAGGRQVATQVTGLPAGSRVRKVTTDQGLFAVLLAGGAEDGAVYTWGVHFDITAGQVLADVEPVRVLNLPPVRDLMPGAFQAYGQRPTDRDTALAVDYDGNYWRIRGRVAERYDPADPLAQRRPKGQAPRPDCGTCHTVRGRTVPTMPTSGPTCDNIPSTILSLLTSQSACESCHNGAPLSNRSALSILNCAKPALPAPAARSEPDPLTTSCSVPASGHPAVGPGVPCSTCHNSVIASPLKCEATAATFAAPLATGTTITQILDDNALAISPGGATADTTPSLQGTITGPLSGGETVQVLRDGALVGDASLSGTSWSFDDAGLTTGRYVYTARVASSGSTAFGPLSASYVVNVDLVSPNQTLTIASVTDSVPSNVGAAGFAGTFTASPVTTDDTTPVLGGTLSTALGGSETLRVLRNGVEVGTAIVNGLAWTFTDDLASLGNATYAYQLRVRDAAGNTGTPSNTFNVNLLTGPPATVNIVMVLAPGSIVNGGSTSDATPQLQLSFSRGLLAGERLVLTRLRSGDPSAVELAFTQPATGATSFVFDDTIPGNGTYTYGAKIANDAGNEQTPPSAFTLTCSACISLNRTIAGLAIDVNAPSSASNVANGAVIGDTTPTVRGSASGTWPASGLSVVLIRSGPGGTIERNATLDSSTGAWTFTEPSALGNGTYTYSARVQDGSGNRGATSATRSVTVSVLPSFQAGSLSSFVDNVSPVTGSALASNTATDDTTPTLSVSLGAALSTGQSLSVRGSANGGAATTLSVAQSPAGTGATSYTLTPTLTNTAIFQAGESESSRLAKIVSYSLQAFASDATGNPATSSGTILVRLLPRCRWGATASHGSTPPLVSSCTSCHTTKGPGYTCRLDPSVALP